MTCKHERTKVIDVRGGAGIRRRRECRECKFRFTTYEISLDEVQKLKDAVKKLNMIRIYFKKIPEVSLSLE